MPTLMRQCSPQNKDASACMYCVSSSIPNQPRAINSPPSWPARPALEVLWRYTMSSGRKLEVRLCTRKTPSLP